MGTHIRWRPTKWQKWAKNEDLGNLSFQLPLDHVANPERRKRADSFFLVHLFVGRIRMINFAHFTKLFPLIRVVYSSPHSSWILTQDSQLWIAFFQILQTRKRISPTGYSVSHNSKRIVLESAGPYENCGWRKSVKIRYFGLRCGLW